MGVEFRLFLFGGLKCADGAGSTCKVSVIAFLFPRCSQHDSLSLPPFHRTRATRKQRTNKPGRCYQPERPFCTLTRYSLPSGTAPFTYMCLSSQVSGGNARARWSLARRTVAGTQDVALRRCSVNRGTSWLWSNVDEATVGNMAAMGIAERYLM